MRNAFADSLYDAASHDERVCVVVADISPAGPMAKFQSEQPERFINTGVAEQAMVGIAAGLALKGFRPFAYTIATFTLYRPFEMVRDDVCYQNLPVTIVGMGSGIVYSTLGSTHHTQEDIAIAGAIPNMQIISPCDPLEVGLATKYCAHETTGPVYLRLGKAGEPTITENAVDDFEIGKIRTIRAGQDVCILSHGSMVADMLKIADTMAEDGVSTQVVNVHTLKPLDTDGIAAMLSNFETVVVAEEHAPQGGLASMVKQLAWDSKANCELLTFTLSDQFIHCYGSHSDLRRAHGLDPELILRSIQLSTGASK